MGCCLLNLAGCTLKSTQGSWNSSCLEGVQESLYLEFRLIMLDMAYHFLVRNDH